MMPDKSDKSDKSDNLVLLIEEAYQIFNAKKNSDIIDKTKDKIEDNVDKTKESLLDIEKRLLKKHWIPMVGGAVAGGLAGYYGLPELGDAIKDKSIDLPGMDEPYSLKSIGEKLGSNPTTTALIGANVGRYIGSSGYLYDNYKIYADKKAKELEKEKEELEKKRKKKPAKAAAFAGI